MLGQFILDERPDVIVCAGDLADMPSLSSYDKGKKSFEGRRYSADIAAVRDALRRINAPMDRYNAQQAKNKQKQYLPRMVMTLGNHECVEEHTEVLTDSGWKAAKEVTVDDNVASFTQDTVQISYNLPVRISYHKDTPIVRLSGHMSNEVVSNTHNFYVRGVLKRLQLGDRINQTSLTFAGKKYQRADYSTDEIELLTWVIMDGTIVRSSENKKRVQFKLSRQDKIDRLSSILTRIGIPFTFRQAVKSGLNKLQPYYITIYGQYARDIDDRLGNVKKLPADWVNFDAAQLATFLDTLVITDGGHSFNHVVWTSVEKSNVDTIQLACIFNNVPCYITEHVNGSGFSNAKLQYRVSIFNRGVSNRSYSTLVDGGTGNVVAIETVDGTLITRTNGKVAFTGNSRIARAINLSPELDGTLNMSDLGYEEHGWEVIPYLTPIEIDGIYYNHFFVSGVKGEAIGGLNPAKAIIMKQMTSCTSAHSHIMDFATAAGPNGRRAYGLVGGCFFEQPMAYAHATEYQWWRGLIIKNNVNNGQYDPEFWSMQRLKARYGA